ncbi:MAG: right-handed parallel beta-helix repeat-containing protein [Nannocystaceae bacterium]
MILRRFAPLTLSTLCLTALFALSACDDDGDDDDDQTSEGTMPSDDGTAAPELPAVTCTAAANRIDPTAARDLTNADFQALGRGRTGASGTGTTRPTTGTRYVSAARGDDGSDGSEATPWRTLQHAADTAEPGTAVRIDASGDYRAFEIHRSGTADAWIVFTAQDPSAPPRVTGTAGTEAVVDIDASFVVVQGLEITNDHAGDLGTDAIGIQVQPRAGDIGNIELRNNLVHDVGPGQVEQDSCSYDGHGIIAQAEGHRVSNLVIDGNEIYDATVGNSEVLVVNGNIADFCVTSNYVHDTNNIGIDIIGYEKNDTETTRRGMIADNVVLDASNYWPYCSRGNCTYPYGDESSDGIYVDGGADLLIEYNVVGRADHGIELQSENGQLIRNVEVAFNVVFNSNYRNFTLGPAEASGEHDNQFFDDPRLADAELESCK